MKNNKEIRIEEIESELEILHPDWDSEQISEYAEGKYEYEVS